MVMSQVGTLSEQAQVKLTNARPACRWRSMETKYFKEILQSNCFGNVPIGVPLMLPLRTGPIESVNTVVNVAGAVIAPFTVTVQTEFAPSSPAPVGEDAVSDVRPLWSSMFRLLEKRCRRWHN
jgi:hypothetical protein